MRPVNRASVIQRSLDQIAGLIEPQLIRDGLGSFKVLDQFGLKLLSAIGLPGPSDCSSLDMVGNYAADGAHRFCVETRLIASNSPLRRAISGAILSPLNDETGRPRNITPTVSLVRAFSCCVEALARA